VEKITWADHVRNEVLQRVEEGIIVQTIQEGRLIGLVTCYVGIAV